MIKAIVGANWGDEGKGKITDLLAEEASVVLRFQGGANAGHTIINDYGKFALHLLPSGVFNPEAYNVIGNGVAFDADKFKSEYESLIERGVPAPKILISERVQLVMPYHVLFDSLEEERLGKKSFGSTKSGIAPFYADKYAKIGFQAAELFDDERLRAKLRGVLELKNCLLEHLYGREPLALEPIFEKMLEWRAFIAPFLGDASAFLRQVLDRGETVLAEGQLGGLKDPDFGIYPFTTSSSTLAGFAAVGGGLSPRDFGEIIAVTKAYSSAVGAGAFVSEIFGEEAEELRRRGGDSGEYGATTGRARRVGWFDVPATRYGCRIQGASEAALTNLDVLGYLDRIPVCTAYELDGEIIEDFPVTPKLERCKPVIEYLPGWKCDLRGVTDEADLPEEAKAYVSFLEEKIGLPIRYLSTGPARHELIRR